MIPIEKTGENQQASEFVLVAPHPTYNGLRKNLAGENDENKICHSSYASVWQKKRHAIW